MGRTESLRAFVGLPGAVFELALWWVAGTVFWLAMASTITLAETVVAAAVALAGASGAARDAAQGQGEARMASLGRDGSDGGHCRLRTPDPLARRGFAVFDPSLRALRGLHSGRVGDYVVWMVIGVAVAGAGLLV